MVAAVDGCSKWNKSPWESQMLPKTFCLFFLDFRYMKSHMHRWYDIRCKTIWKSKGKEVKWPGRQCGREYAQSISYTCVNISCNSRPCTMNIQQGDKKIPKLSDFFSMIQTFSSYAAMLGSGLCGGGSVLSLHSTGRCWILGSWNWIELDAWGFPCSRLSGFQAFSISLSALLPCSEQLCSRTQSLLWSKDSRLTNHRCEQPRPWAKAVSSQEQQR